MIKKNILLFILLFIILISFYSNDDVKIKKIDDVLNYNWESQFYIGIENSENDIEYTNFYFLKSVKKVLIEIKTKDNNKNSLTIWNYNINNNKIWIYGKDPGLPFYVFKNEKNILSILTPAATMGLKFLKKLDKNKIVYKVKIENLRLRKSPEINSNNFIRTLNRNEILVLIEYGKKDTISGVTGKWIKVYTENNDVGWCFDYYIKLID